MNENISYHAAFKIIKYEIKDSFDLFDAKEIETQTFSSIQGYPTKNEALDVMINALQEMKE